VAKGKSSMGKTKNILRLKLMQKMSNRKVAGDDDRFFFRVVRLEPEKVAGLLQQKKARTRVRPGSKGHSERSGSEPALNTCHPGLRQDH